MFPNPIIGNLIQSLPFLCKISGTWHFTAMGYSRKGYVFIMEKFSLTHWGFYFLTHQLKSSANFSLLLWSTGKCLKAPHLQKERTLMKSHSHLVIYQSTPEAWKQKALKGGAGGSQIFYRKKYSVFQLPGACEFFPHLGPSALVRNAVFSS